MRSLKQELRADCMGALPGRFVAPSDAQDHRNLYWNPREAYLASHEMRDVDRPIDQKAETTVADVFNVPLEQNLSPLREFWRRQFLSPHVTGQREPEVASPFLCLLFLHWETYSSALRVKLLS